MSVGEAFGSFCDVICGRKEIEIESCIHHGTTYVLFGHYGDKQIVMKRKGNDNSKFIKQEIKRKFIIILFSPKQLFLSHSSFVCKLEYHVSICTLWLSLYFAISVLVFLNT